MRGGAYKALDFGCGVGRMTILLSEFGIDAYGIDISTNAINEAKQLIKLHNAKAQVNTYDGLGIPYPDGFFDFCISEGVIDSMPFKLAKQCLKEIDRVTKKFFYLSLISSNSIALFSQTKFETEQFDGEIEVQDQHEFGTIQSFYNLDKINQLISETSFKIKWGEQIIHQNIKDNTLHGRYHIVLEKQE